MVFYLIIFILNILFKVTSQVIVIFFGPHGFRYKGILIFLLILFTFNNIFQNSYLLFDFLSAKLTFFNQFFRPINLIVLNKKLKNQEKKSFAYSFHLDSLL